MLWQKKFQAMIKNLFISSRTLNISLAKDARLNSAHYFIMKINNRIELKNIAIDHSADIDQISGFLKKIIENPQKNHIIFGNRSYVTSK